MVKSNLDRLFAFGIRLLSRCPPWLTLPLINLIVEMLDFLFARGRRAALANLHAASIPHPPRVWRALKRYWSRHAHHLLHLRSRDEIACRWRAEGLEHLHQARAAGRPILFAFFHLGPWEEALHGLAIASGPALVLVRPLPFAAFEAEVEKRRRLSGHRFLSVHDSLRPILPHLHSGGSLLLAADLFPRTGGIRLPFLGRDAWVDDKPARLAAQTHSILLPLWSEPGVGHIEAPIDTSDPRAATLALIQLAERRIRQHPHLWIWMHRRWRERNP